MKNRASLIAILLPVVIAVGAATGGHGSMRWWSAGAVLAGGALGLGARALRRSVGADYLVPRQLPARLGKFVGRDRELGPAATKIRSLSGAPKIVVFRGPSGIGTSAAALALAYGVANEFPDGQIYTNLRASALQGSAGEPWLLLQDQILAAFGVPSASGNAPTLPDEIAMRRRILLVIDDVDDLPAVLAAQPRLGGWGIIIATSNTSEELPGALSVPLPPLTQAESVQILEDIVTAKRTDKESVETLEIAERTEGLPLAIQATAARLSMSPRMRLSDAVSLVADQPAAAETGAFDLCYALLTDEEQRAVRALGYVQASSVAPWQLAALIGVDDHRAVNVADSLARMGLLERTSIDAVGIITYLLPAAVREFGLRLLEATNPGSWVPLVDRVEQLRLQRVVNAADAARLREAVFLRLTYGDVLGSVDTARHAIALARESGDRVGEGLAIAAFAHVRIELGNYAAATDLAQSALVLAADSDPVAASAHRALGVINQRQRRRDSTDRELRVALEHCGDDPEEQCQVLRELALVQVQGVRPDDAETTLNLAFDQCRLAPDRCSWLLPALYWSSSVVHQILERPDESATAIEAGRRAAGPVGTGGYGVQHLWLAWLMLRDCQLNLSRNELSQARASGYAALEAFTVINHRYGAACTRLALGETCRRQGEVGRARQLFDAAHEVFASSGDRWSEAEATRLLAVTDSDEHLALDAREVFADVGDSERSNEAHLQLTGIRRARAHGQAAELAVFRSGETP